MKSSTYYLYMIRSNEDALYAGFTTNLDRRLREHTEGKGAFHLRNKSGLEFVYLKKYSYYKNVLRAERKLKKYTRERKEELIKNYERDLKPVNV